MSFPLPAMRAIGALGVTLALTFATAMLLPGFWFAGLIPAVVLLLFCLIDGVAAMRLPVRLTATELPGTVVLSGNATGDEAPLLQGGRIALEAPPGTRLRARLDMEGPLITDLPAAPVSLRPDEEGRAGIAFALEGRRRGDALIERLWLRVTGPMGLMQRQTIFPLNHAIKVIPNLPRAIRRAVNLSLSDRTTGAMMPQFRAAGGEFDALVDYHPGMDRRHIHWRQSARHRSLLVKDYRDERNHHVVLAFDTGFLMIEEPETAATHIQDMQQDALTQGRMSRLDMAIEAGLSLGAAALRQGDAVGLYAFGPQVDAWLPPRTGGATVLHALNTAAGTLPYHGQASNFTLGLSQLALRLKRRSLILLFTEFTDAISADLLMEGLARLQRTHLVVFVALEDPALNALIRQPPVSPDAIAGSVVAADLARDRRIVFERLSQAGIDTIETPAKVATAAVIERYLAIKHGNRL